MSSLKDVKNAIADPNAVISAVKKRMADKTADEIIQEGEELIKASSDKSAARQAAESTPAPPAEGETAVITSARIEGAFGKKLGDVFDIKSALSTKDGGDGNPQYKFTPDVPFRSFDDYFLQVTPTTHKIYSIYAIGNQGSNRGKAEQEVRLIAELLSQKYGPSKSNYNGHSIMQKDASVFVDTLGISSVRIYYTSDEFSKLAEKERLATETKKVNSDGL